MLFLIAIATIGAAGTAIGTGIAYACTTPPCPHPGDSDDSHGQSSNDIIGDQNSHNHIA
jgi:hypothetical protein